MLSLLINELTALSDLCILVLDDYHLIDDQQIQAAMRFWLEQLPPQLHLVLTSRSEPLLPLARLLARGQISELHAADLRFTLAEATAFLQERLDVTLTHDQIATLEARTEGWVVGLQFAALSLQGAADPAAKQQFIQSLNGRNRHIVDYLGMRKKLSLPNSSGGDGDKPLIQTRKADNFRFDIVHSLLGELDTGGIGCRDQFDERMAAFPGHGFGKVEHGLDRVKQRTIPVMFECAPAAFNGIVLAMVGGIIGELDGHLVAVDKVNDSGHELGAPTMIFRSIIQVEGERRDGGKTLLDGLPTVAEAIDQAITRDLSGHPIDEQIGGRRQQDAHGRNRRLCFEVVVTGLGCHSTLAFTRKRTDRHRGFGIQGEP